MINFGERKDLLVLFILGILIVVGTLIFAFIMIWKPAEKKEFEVGVVNTETLNITDDYKAYQYIKKLSNYFKNEDYNGLYSILASDYIEYSKVTLDNIKDKIISAKLNGQELYMENNKVKKIDDYNNVYSITARGKSNDRAINFIVREKSPRQFELAFDDFISYNLTEYKKSAENVMFSVDSIMNTTTSTIFTISITNNNKNNIVLNSGSYSNNCFSLKYMDGEMTSKTPITNDRVNIAPGRTEKYEIIFETASIDLRYLYGITLKNVKITNDKTIDIYFKFE